MLSAKFARNYRYDALQCVPFPICYVGNWFNSSIRKENMGSRRVIGRTDSVWCGTRLDWRALGEEPLSLDSLEDREHDPMLSEWISRLVVYRESNRTTAIQVKHQTWRGYDFYMFTFLFKIRAWIQSCAKIGTQTYHRTRLSSYLSDGFMHIRHFHRRFQLQ